MSNGLNYKRGYKQRYKDGAEEILIHLNNFFASRVLSLDPMKYIIFNHLEVNETNTSIRNIIQNYKSYLTHAEKTELHNSHYSRVNKILN